MKPLIYFAMDTLTAAFFALIIALAVAYAAYKRPRHEAVDVASRAKRIIHYLRPNACLCDADRKIAAADSEFPY